MDAQHWIGDRCGRSLLLLLLVSPLKAPLLMKHAEPLQGAFTTAALRVAWVRADVE